MRLCAGTDGPRIRVFEKLPPTYLGLPTYLGRVGNPYLGCLGRVGKSFRIDARQGDAGSFADPGVTVVLLRLLERGDGILGLFAKPAKFDGGAAADVVAPMPEGFDQRRNDLFRVALSARCAPR